MDDLKKERYEPPEVEILQVAVECGFAATSADTELPNWKPEEGYWQ